jgi:hypothetical protein
MSQSVHMAVAILIALIGILMSICGAYWCVEYWIGRGRWLAGMSAGLLGYAGSLLCFWLALSWGR